MSNNLKIRIKKNNNIIFFTLKPQNVTKGIKNK